MASRREVVVATENYLRSKGYNNSTGKYDRVIMGVKSLLGETLLTYGSPEFERAIQQETERMLKKYVKDEAMEYDPIMCMMVPKKAEDAKTWVVEYEDALGDDHKKTFTDKTAVEKFIRRGTDVGKAYHLKVNGKAVNNTATWTADAKAEDVSMVYDEIMAMMKPVKMCDAKNFKLRIYNNKGFNAGNLKIEEFFDTKEEMDKRYRQLVDKSHPEYNPTAWENSNGNWARLSGY